MSSTKVNSGVTATGACNFNGAAANVSTVTALIDASNTYTQVSTCTSTNNGILLPSNPIPNTKYTIRNDGAFTLGVAPNGVGSGINAIPVLSALGANVQLSCFYIGPGASCDFIVNTNSQATSPVISWYTSNYSGNPPVFILAGAATIRNDMSGSVLLASGAGAYTVTLPAAATSLGNNFKVIMNVAGGSVVSVGRAAAGNVYGGGIGAVTTPIACVGVNTYNFAAAAIIGDWMHWTCDGTNWYVEAMGHVTVAFSTS